MGLIFIKGLSSELNTAVALVLLKDAYNLHIKQALPQELYSSCNDAEYKLNQIGCLDKDGNFREPEDCTSNRAKVICEWLKENI